MRERRCVELYTDGAVRGNGGPGRIGMAALLRWVPAWGEPAYLEREYSWHLDLEYATNIRAEIEAIAGGLDRVRPAARPGCDLRLLTDSLWSKNAIEGRQRVNCYQAQVAAIRQQLAGFARWEIHHVRGHTGVDGNERCDHLAVLQTQRSAGL